MKKEIEACYWETDENIISLQLVAKKEDLTDIEVLLGNTQLLASGTDYKRDKEIVIYRKLFTEQQDMKKFLSELKLEITNLKEVT